MRRLLSAFCLSFALLFTVAAHADTYSVININSASNPGQGQTVLSQANNYDLSNTSAIVFAYNPTGTGSAVPGTLNFTIDVNTVYGLEVFNVSGTTSSYFSPGFDSSLFSSSPLIYTASSGPAEYNLVFSSNNSQGSGSTETIYAQFFPNSTFVAPVQTAATPEPGSLVLLGTGMLGVAGAVRRKLFA